MKDENFFISEKAKQINFPKKGILAQAKEAKEKKINATLGEAYDDDGIPFYLEKIYKDVSLSPHEIFSYGSCYGNLDLRQKWKEFILKKNPSIKTEISLPVVTSGLTHALSIAAKLFFKENDELIIPDKFWGNYKLIFEVGNGVKLDCFNSFTVDGFDLVSLEKKIESKDSISLLLNFPNNPTGYSLRYDEVENLLSILKKQAEKNKKIIIICDDAYFGLSYEDDIDRESFFARLCDLHENILAVKVDGTTKEDFAWGLRVGFITFASKRLTDYTFLEDKVAACVRQSISSVSNLSQNLIVKAFSFPSYEQDKSEKLALLKKRYKKVKEVIKDEKFIKFFYPLPFNSGYFMCIKLIDVDSEKLRQHLLQKYDVGVIALNENLIRIAFSSVPEKEIENLFESIYQGCLDLSR
jgi:aspartate/methionine/tyrosine aminotransferase